MGFAIVPVIYSIAEEALSNVPKSQIAGSLALGATRWQTVLHLVLLSASPGIFSGVMIGFGRAIGETMIVLMATGNTPILDWNWANGFRTLSANIAVEIPEAPHGGSLYRVLFLAALLLFIVTFVINSLAELVRQPAVGIRRLEPVAERGQRREPPHFMAAMARPAGRIGQRLAQIMGQRREPDNRLGR